MSRNFLIALVAVISLSAAASAADRPNILWITSEDNGADLGAYGFEYAHTPALDALPKETAIYTRAFATAGVCAPARSTIITGMYPPALGSEHMRSRVPLPEGIKMYPQYLREAGYYCTNNSKEDYNLIKPEGVWDQSNNKAHWKNRPEGKPFFAIFNHTVSHESKIRLGEKSFPYHKIEDAPVPPYHPNIPETKRDWAQYHANLSKLDDKVANNLKEIKDAGLEDDTIVFYYGDHGSGMPRHKRWLWDSGIHIPLLVKIPEKWKHLRECAPGEKTGRLVSFVDLAPTALSLAGVKPPAHMHGKSFLGEHAVDARRYIHAFRGRMDERFDMVRAVRDDRYKLLRNYNPHQVYGQFIAYMFQTDTTRIWKKMYDNGELNAVQSAFWEKKPYEEFYDTQSDPHEIKNLADDPAHAEALKRMRGEMDRWLLDIRDLGFLPEGEMHARRGDMTPYDLGKDSAKYSLTKVKNAAERALTEGQSDLDALRELMADSDAAVRYWGVVGALNIGQRAAQLNAELTKLCKDSSEDVRIVAAQALHQLGEGGMARKVLSDIMDEGKTFARLRAMTVLDQMDEAARPVVQRIAQTGDATAIGAYGENYIGSALAKACADLGIDPPKKPAKKKQKRK